MKTIERISNFFRWISEAVGSVFSPVTDHYPATGVIPYGGDATHASGWLE